MLRNIGKIISGVIFLFLFLVILVKVFFISQEKIYDNNYPNILGYSYFKFEGEELVPEIKYNEFLLLNNNEEIKVNDYVLYLSNSGKNIKKVSKIEETGYTLTDNTNNNVIISKDEVLSKVVYTNYSLSILLNILTNKIVVLAMIIFSFILPSLTYKRY